jgi:hypothetical protein
MSEEKIFYTVYSYSDKLQPGNEITIKHNISFNESRANLSPLVSLSPDELKDMKLVSEEKEKTIFEKLCAAVEEWEQQAAQTLLLGKALEYVKTPAVRHTSNQWQKGEYDNLEVSNMVYKMSYRIREETQYNRASQKSVPCAWSVSWSVDFNAPQKRDYYSGSSCKIAGQDQKRYTDKAAAEKYVQGRIDAYAYLFTELSPPIPEENKNIFSVNGHLLPGYSLKPHEPTVMELLSFVQEQDISAAVAPPVEDREAKQSTEAEKRPAKKKSPNKTKRNRMTR